MLFFLPKTFEQLCIFVKCAYVDALGYFDRIYLCYFSSTKLVENGFNIQYLFIVQTLYIQELQDVFSRF